MDDGTILSLGLTIGSALVWLIGVGYVVLDTGFDYTSYWASSYNLPNRNIFLYVTYLLLPLVWIVLFLVLELILVIKVLGETRPLLFLGSAAIAFAAGQVFNFVVSPHICNGTSGAIDGSLFQTLFTLIAVVLIWFFWSSITEDDWPMPVQNPYP
jgi:Chitin synthase export chaperone